VIITTSVAVIILGMCALLWSSATRTGPIRVTNTFCGFTHDATGARLAAFRVSNCGVAGIHRWHLYVVEEQGRSGPLYRASFNGGAYLAPDHSGIYTLPVPTNAAAWRLVLYFSRDSWLTKAVEQAPPIRWVMSTTGASFRVDEATSDWVGAGSSTPPATGPRQRMANVILRGPTAPPAPTNAAPP
jgi:hypothetical protein